MIEVSYFFATLSLFAKILENCYIFSYNGIEIISEEGKARGKKGES